MNSEHKISLESLFKIMNMNVEALLSLWISQHWLLALELFQSLFQQGSESWIDIIVGTVKEACQIHKDLLPSRIWLLAESDLDSAHDLEGSWIFFQAIAHHGIRR